MVIFVAAFTLRRFESQMKLDTGEDLLPFSIEILIASFELSFEILPKPKRGNQVLGQT